jgi:ketosteroid isomerase-like protein
MTDVKRQLESVIQVAEAALASGADVAEFVDLLYDDGVVVVGDGWPVAIHGVQALLPKLEGMFKEWGSRPKMRLMLLDPILTEGSVATAFVDARVTPSGPGAAEERYRVLYAWKHGARGWRVALEMFAEGAISSQSPRSLTR